MYKSRSTASAVKAVLPTGTLVYAGSKKKVGSITWYKAKTKKLRKNYSGYIRAKNIKFQPVTAKSTKYKVAIVRLKSGVYKKANSTSKKLGAAAKKTDVIILGSLKVAGKKWAKCKTKYGTGYIVYSRLTPVTATTKNTSKYSATVTKKSKTYRVASLLASNKGTANAGTSVLVLGELTVNSVHWYKVSFSNGTSNITGYIPSASVELSSDAMFSEALAEFPASYHASLTALHQAHPSWIFKPVKTGLSWNDVIANEKTDAKNTIQSNCPKGGNADTYSAPFSYLSTAPGDYDWSTDTYSLRDGTNWYTANENVIAYYIDPRNFLSEEGIFQFESLSYEANQTAEVVQTMLNNTFMSGNYNVTDILTKENISGSYCHAFMDAATASSVSPYYLVTRVKNEVGVSGSNSTSGTYKGYEGYYNFYNIGANDSATGQAVANGLSWAKKGSTYNRPWTTPYKSIVGGAQYIAGQYITLGQNTMYTQKFNVVVPKSLYTHQYMTAVTASLSYSKSNYNTYNNNKLLDNSYTFYIPYYNDMPEACCALPESKGNPNSFLKSLKIKNNKKEISMNSTFNYATTSYTAYVSGVSKVNITAEPVSSRSKVSGTGTYNLVSGNNTITVTCTAEDGTKTDYKIVIAK